MRQGDAGGDVRADLEAELINDPNLLAAGDVDSSLGSDSAPSKDNLDAVSLQKMMPNEVSPHNSR